MRGASAAVDTKSNMNRLVQRHAAANVHERSIFSKRRVQSAKRIALDIQIAAEVSFECGRVLLNLFFQARDCDACGQISEYRQARGQMSVDKHKLGSCAFQPPSFKSEFESCTRVARQENAVRAIADTLVKRQSSSCVVGKSSLAETRKGIFAQLPQPRLTVPRRPLRELGEAFQILFEVFSCSIHACSTQRLLVRDCSLENARYTEAGAVCRASSSIQP